MGFNPKKLRIAIAGAGILLLAAVIGFYSFAKYKVAKEIREIPQRLGADIQQSAAGFTYTQSSGGKALFTISAGKAVQFKEGQKAQLENVRIIVYGEDDEYDQIFGKAFAYDPGSGQVTAQGEVMIDLQAQGKPGSDPLRDGEKGRVHFLTSGLSFNQKTGLAETKETITFTIPQARGSARGALYDSRLRTLTLADDVRLATTQSAGTKLQPTQISAARARIEDQPLRAVLTRVRMEQADRAMNANEVTILLREDNSIAKLTALGEVMAEAKGKTTSQLRAQRADFNFAADNLLQKAVLTGAVSVRATGASALDGAAGRAVIDFTGRNHIAQVRASEAVRFQQKGAGRPATAVEADVVDFFFRGKSQLQRAVTSGASKITMQPEGAGGGAANSTSVITAAGFTAAFTAQNRMSSLSGTPNAKLVTTTPGQPERVVSAHRMVASFDTRSAARTSIRNIEVEGKVDYKEGQRSATAERGRFNPGDDTLHLEGSPRVQDDESGFIIAAKTLRLNRRSGEVSGQDDVKTTYRQVRANAGGAMFSGSDPIHATSQAVSANRSTGVARFTGGARLWQGANMVQAPTIVFERDRRALTATGNNTTRVQTVFVQSDKAGKQVPVQVSALRLTYVDAERKGHFEGGVKVKVPDTTLTAGRVDVLLKGRAAGANASGAASQVDQIIATGDQRANVILEQENPVRRAVGERLVYVAEEAKFVLTGTAGNPPSIFDAERGNLTGDSLTFYTRDDRVHVGSGDSSRTITRTRIKDESKP